MEKAWIGNCNSSETILILNIGGKTTELVIIRNDVVIDKKISNLGVGTIIKKFVGINNCFSVIPLNIIIDYVKEELPYLGLNIDFAIYAGGELNYMKITDYYLQKNLCFSDSKHPSMIMFKDYCQRNEKVFSELTIKQLRSLLPENPSWMDGARACSALAQAICDKYFVDKIIPSDSNLIDGVCLQEFRNVVVCGSFNKYMNSIKKLSNCLKMNNVSILSPAKTEVVSSESGFVLFHGEKVINECTWPIERKHLIAIEECDAVLICNYDNYIGRSTSTEIGYAIAYGKKIVFLENNKSVDDFNFPCEIGLIQIFNS